MNLCRLCGEEKSPLDLSFELNDKTNTNWSYRDLIEHHTRVSLKLNKLLPQSVCEECRTQIDGFVGFSNKIQEIQNGFETEELDPVQEIKECFVQIEPLDGSTIASGSQAKVDKFAEFSKNIREIQQKFDEQEEVDAVDDVIFRNRRRPRKRKTKNKNEDSSVQQSKKPKHGNFEAVTIKVEPENLAQERQVSDQDEVHETVNLKPEYKDESTSSEDDATSRSKTESTNEKPKRSISQMPYNTKEQSLYGPEVDTLEKLFEDEIRGSSKFPRLRLNVPECCKQANGEVPEEFAKQVGTLRWKDILSCLLCNLRFTNILEMKKHQETAHNLRTKVFGCHICENGGQKGGAISETTLLNHLVERHYFEHLLFCCMVCSKMFYDRKSLHDHYKKHDGGFYTITCFICGFSAKDLEALKYHKAQHVTKEMSEKSNNLLLCEKIQDKFDRGVLENPTNPLVGENDRNPDGTVSEECQERLAVDWSFGTYNCPLCTLTYTNPFDIYVHTSIVHSSKPTKKIYDCNMCKVQKKHSLKHQFDQIFTYFNHAIDERHHENLQFSCIVCSKVFWNILALVNHYKQVHPAFSCVPCNHCGKVFQNCAFASHHLNKEVAEGSEKIVRELKDEQVCEICRFKCRKKQALDSHRKTVHKMIKPEDMAPCTICGRVFPTKIKLRDHMNCHTTVLHVQCEMCDRTFRSKRTLKLHMQAVHEEKRDRKCEFCERTFFSIYALQVHTRTHTNERPYKCSQEHCSSSFFEWGKLFLHMKNVHSIDIRSENYKKRVAANKEMAKETKDNEDS